jgi:hypothetical protein
MFLRRTIAAAAIVCLALSASGRAQTPPTVSLTYDRSGGAIAFAAVDLQQALQSRGYRVVVQEPNVATPAIQSGNGTRIWLGVQGDRFPAVAPPVTGLSPQGFSLLRASNAGSTTVWAIGQDVAGAMYAGLELAERVRTGERLESIDETKINPRIAQRGIKFNIPLDARTPSYSDDSTSAQGNIPAMWDMAFWTRYLDEMARHRYNLLSLWSLAPFPSLVKVPDYPDVALADVKRKTGPMFDATNIGTRMFDPSWPLETVKVMSIDQKIAFWRQVMQHAKDRGIDITIFTWNIFTHGTEGTKYGITDDPSNPVTKDYFRKSVRALFNTYPLLASIGITSGEHMDPLNAVGKEQWLWETYGQGVADAMADAKNPSSPYYAPTRKIRLIHRAHQADLASIVSHFSQLPGAADADSTLAFSFKYSEAHMYSSTTPKFIYQRGWFDSIPPGKKTWLTVRNDDMYYMRWGDPDFVRAYLGNLPEMSKIAGFYMGPDGYNWGRDLTGKTGAPSQLVIEKQWYSFLLWGRLAYDPSIPDSRLKSILAARFPAASTPSASSNLFDGWASVSRILPLYTRFYWGNLDFKWYPEASWSQSGFESVQQLIDGRYVPMTADEDGQMPLIMSVKSFVNGDAPAGRMTPIDVAATLERDASGGLDKIATLQPGTDKTLDSTLADIRAMAWLGRYYAAKTRGAVDLARYQKAHRAADHASATTHLKNASAAWKEYVVIWSAHYLPQHLTRMGPQIVDIAAIQKNVDADIPAPLAP